MSRVARKRIILRDVSARFSAYLRPTRAHIPSPFYLAPPVREPKAWLNNAPRARVFATPNERRNTLYRCALRDTTPLYSSPKKKTPFSNRRGPSLRNRIPSPPLAAFVLSRGGGEWMVLASLSRPLPSDVVETRCVFRARLHKSFLV